MTIEEKLKSYIKSKYGSIRAFTLATGVPYGNIDSLLRRGIEGVTWNTVLVICHALNIDVDALAEGEIVPKFKGNAIDLLEVISNYKEHPCYQIDGIPLSDCEQKQLITALEIAVGIIRSGRC